MVGTHECTDAACENDLALDRRDFASVDWRTIAASHGVFVSGIEQFEEGDHGEE